MVCQEPKLEKLFTPIRIKSMELKNRVVMAPMCTLLANADGSASDRLIEYYEARAKGGAALISVEVAEVHPSSAFGIGEIGIASIYDDKFIPSWKRFCERIHAAGAKTSMQLHHPGRQFPALGPERPPWAPSVVPCPCPLCQDVPHQMTIAEIEEMVHAFGEGARRAKEAGFDAVEVHGAHGYLIAQFMSSYANRRTDKYGGDLHSRMRFPMEILYAVRERVGPNFPIVFRLSADERVPGGRTVEESVAIAPMLVAAGTDCLSITTGVYVNLYTYFVAPMAVPKGLNVDAAERVKKAVDVPIIVVGKLNDPLMAEQVLAQGKADLVAIGRGLLADPELPNKAAAGQFEDIRWCTACNQGCIYSFMNSFNLTCVVNPELTKERQMAITPVAKTKRVLVAGGGPAGMEAARVAALRGHDVTLYEKEPELGGQFRIATIPPAKQEIVPFLKYLSRQLDKAGVKVMLGEAVTASVVEKMKPDAVVVATGGKPLIPDIPGINADNVVAAHDVLTSKAITGNKVLIAGGGMVGCETADFLAERGRHVTIVEMLPEIASDIAPGPKFFLLQRLAEQGVRSVTSATIKKITADSVVIDREGKEETIGSMDTIVLALGVASLRELEDELKDKVNEVYVIGDAKTPATAMEAIAAGAEIGRQI